MYTECKMYITIGKTFHLSIIGTDKFSELISTENVKLLNLLAKYNYVHKAYELSLIRYVIMCLLALNCNIM